MKLAVIPVLIIYYNFASVQAKKVDAQELRCLVCKISLDELNKAVSNIDSSKTVPVGGYRLDSDGNYIQKTVSQAKSEVHLSELIEEICTKMDDYVRATWKNNGTLTLFRLIEDGKMNPIMSEVDLVQDEDLNKSLKYYCEGIMEELEENIIKHYQNDSPDIHKKVCIEESAICDKEKSYTAKNDEL